MKKKGRKVNFGTWTYEFIHLLMKHLQPLPYHFQARQIHYNSSIVDLVMWVLVLGVVTIKRVKKGVTS